MYICTSFTLYTINLRIFYCYVYRNKGALVYLILDHLVQIKLDFVLCPVIPGIYIFYFSNMLRSPRGLSSVSIIVVSQLFSAALSYVWNYVSNPLEFDGSTVKKGEAKGSYGQWRRISNVSNENIHRVNWMCANVQSPSIPAVTEVTHTMLPRKRANSSGSGSYRHRTSVVNEYIGSNPREIFCHPWRIVESQYPNDLVLHPLGAVMILDLEKDLRVRNGRYVTRMRDFTQPSATISSSLNLLSENVLHNKRIVEVLRADYGSNLCDIKSRFLPSREKRFFTRLYLWR